MATKKESTKKPDNGDGSTPEPVLASPESLIEWVETSPAIRTSANTTHILPALLAAQKAMGNAVKDATNPHFKSSYPTLTSVLDASKAVLNDHGIIIVQGANGDGQTTGVGTTLFHESGEWIATYLPIQAQEPGPQPTGSVVTYGRRYTLASILGLGVEDDDGNSGQHRSAGGFDVKIDLDAIPRDVKAMLVELGIDAPGKARAKLYAFMKQDGTLDLDGARRHFSAQIDQRIENGGE